MLLALLMLTPATAEASEMISTVAGTGTAGFSGDGGAATAAQLSIPIGVAVAPGGGFYVVDQANNRIRRVTAGGTISSVAGTVTPGFSGDGGPATAAQFDALNAISVLGDGSLLVADSNNNRVRRFSVGGTISTVAGTGAAAFGGDGGGADAAQLRFPSDVAVLPGNGYLVADTDNHRIRQVTPGGTITTVAGTSIGFGGDGSAATSAQLSKPSGVSPTSDGGFLIADTDNHRIRKVSAGGTITTVAGTGAVGSAGDGGAATAATLNLPTRVAALPDGGYLVSDRGAHRVRRVSAAGVISTVAGTGTAGAAGDSGPATSAQLNFPYGVAATSGGDVLIADTFNHRVREVTTGVASGTVPALIDADVSSVNGNVARGSLAGRTMTLSGTVVDGTAGASVVDGTGTTFAAPEFGIPGLAHSDEVAIEGRNGYAYQLKFATPVTDPVLAIGSLASRLDFPVGTTMTRLRGQSSFTVSGRSVSGALAGGSPSDANGVVQLMGTFSTISFTATPLFGGGTTADGIYVLPALATGPRFSPQLVRWPLDNAFSATARDFSGNGVDGTTLAGARTAGRFAKALTLSSPGDGFEVTNPLLEPAGSFSWVAWVRSAGSPGADKAIVAKGGKCGDPSYTLNTGGNGGLEFSVQLPGPAAAQSTVVRTPPIAPAGIWDGSWHAVTAVYDIASGGTTRSVTLWIDGTPGSTQAVPAGLSATIDYFSAHITDRQFTVGHLRADPCNQDHSFSGQLDELRLYETALDRRQITYLHRPSHTDPPNFDGDTSPLNTARPVLSGTPMVGSEVSCTNGDWTGAAGSLTYTTVWERAPRTTTSDDDPTWGVIDGAAGSPYRVRAADAGSRIRCRVTRADAGGSAEAVSGSVQTDTGPPVSTAAPQLSGYPTFLKDPLTLNLDGVACLEGRWDNNPDFAYQWLRDGVPISAAQNPTAVQRIFHQRRTRNLPGQPPQPDGDGNHLLSCRVTGTNGIGSADATSPQLLAVDDVPLHVSGPFVSPDAFLPGDSPVAKNLTCVEGDWIDGYGKFRQEPYSYHYTWRREGVVIGGAASRLYEMTVADLGRRVTCEVIDANPVGESAPAESGSYLVPLPKGDGSAKIFSTGGRNEADPTNLLALSNDYQQAVNGVVVDRLKKSVSDVTAACAKRGDVPSGAPEPSTVRFIGNIMRCRILLHAPERVSVTYQGVRYLNGACTPDEALVTATLPGCRSLRIQVPAIDPKRPPATDQDLLARLAPVTPQTILWDLNDDGRTDVACPGSAPVLRTILENGTWNPKVVIVNGASADTGVFPSGTQKVRAPSNNFYRKAGVLRPAQVKVCATAFDPPPDPETTPCVTTAVIGRVQVTGDLCPISARAIASADYNALDGPLKALLQAQSENLLKSEGTITSRALRDRLDPVYVSLEDPGAHHGARHRLRATAADPANLARAAILSNTLAATTSIGSALPSSNDISSGLRTDLKDVSAFVPRKAGFALDQIYVARDNGMTLNGVTIDPLGNSLALLVPSDAGDALSSIHSMTVSARNAASRLGPLGQKNGLPLALGGALKAQIPDAKTAATALLRQVDLDDLKRALKDKAADLDLGPFKLAGDAKVTLENDGTASLEAYAEVPGLAATPGGPGLRVDIRIKGDLSGRLQLQGVRVRAPYAYLGPVKLQDLDLTYNGGLDVKGKILFPPPISAGIGINRFAIDDQGRFQALDVDYLAGAGTGIAAGPGTFITKLGGGLDLRSSVITGRTTVSIGPSPGGGCPTAGIEAGFNVHFAEPFSLDATGDVLLACINLAQLKFHADQTGLVTLDGTVDFKAGPIFVKGGLGGALRLPHWQVTLSGQGGIRDIPIVGTIKAGVNVTLSDIGLAGCGTLHVPIIDDISAGAAVRFKNGRPPFTFAELLANLHFFDGCDLSAYQSVVPRAVARADGPSAKSFTIPAHAGPVLLSFEGAGDAPRISLRGPDGRTYDFSDVKPGEGKTVGAAYGMVVAPEDRTVVVLPRPVPGTWTAQAVAGSTPILRLRQAKVLPKAKVSARVTGKGTVRKLTYDVAALSGQTVRLVEAARGGQQILRTVKGGGRGTVRFTVSEAASSHRRIDAQVIQDALPRQTLTVARFVAPNPKVGRPGRLRVRRAGSRATVSWRSAALGKVYEVVVSFKGGRSLLLTPRPGSRRVTVAAVARRDVLRVSVVAISPGGRRGPKATAHLTAAARKRGHR